VSGIQVGHNSGLANLQYIALVGTQSGSTPISGLSCTNGAVVSAQNCGAYGWNDSGTNSDGFTATNAGIMTLSLCYATACSNGFLSAQGAYMSATNCYACENYNGFRAETAIMAATGCIAAGNQASAFAVNNRSSLSASNIYGLYNTTGLSIQVHSNVSYGGGGSMSGNTSFDVALADLSSFVRSGGAALGYSTLNVTPGVLSSSGCFFSN
jgi:hypothetical protein